MREVGGGRLMAQLKTHKPSGQAPWPLILLTGEPGAGKSWSAAEFTGSDRVGRCFWLDLGEGCGEEYGEVPGADYEIIDHDGTWVSIIGQVEAVKDVAKTAAAADEPPVVLVIDSMTHEWAMLSEWTDKRARRQKGNIQKLKDDPDVEIDITMNLWNDANSRHNRLMNLVKTFPGIVVLIASEKEVAQLDKGGNPVRNGPKEWKPEGQKFLARDCSVWVRLLREDQPTVVKCRSVHYGIRPGVDRPRKVPDFTLDWLVFELLKCNSKTKARSVATLDADQVMPGEEPPAIPGKDEATAPSRSDRLQLIKDAEAAGDLAKLGEFWVKARGDKTKPPPDPELLKLVEAAASRVKEANRTALKVVVDELLNAHNVEAAISLMEKITARPDVEAEVADLLPESDKETLGIREGQSVHLLDLAEKVSHYTEKHKVGPRVVDPVAA